MYRYTTALVALLESRIKTLVHRSKTVLFGPSGRHPVAHRVIHTLPGNTPRQAIHSEAIHSLIAIHDTIDDY